MLRFGSLAAMAAVLLLPSLVAAQTVISANHVDFMEVDYNGNAWTVAIHNETFDVEFDPFDDGGVFRFDWVDGAVFALGSPGTTFIVPNASWAFTGAGAGQTVWGAVQNGNAATHLQLGFAEGENYIPGTLVGDEVTFTMSVVNGPTGGEVSLYRLQNPDPDTPFGSQVGMEVLIATANADFSFTRELTHTDLNMLFSQPGEYRLQFVFSGIRASDNQPVQSAPYQYVFNVAAVPEPSTLALLGVAGAGAGYWSWRGRSRASRE